MGIVTLDNKEETTEDKPRTAQLIGFDGGMGGDGPWIMKYPVGTIFLGKLTKRMVGPNGQMMPAGYSLTTFIIIWKGRRSIRLAIEMPDGSNQQVPVMPQEFCDHFTLWEIIQMGEEDEAVQGQPDELD
jgi:hypothetical protein